MSLARLALSCAAAALIAAAGCGDKSSPKAESPPTPPTTAKDAPEEREAPAAWQPDRSCAQDDDCRPAPSCCPMPCNGDVINRRDMARAEAELKKTCPTTPADCPSAGSCPGHAYLCVEGTCKLVMEGEPGYPGP